MAIILTPEKLEAGYAFLRANAPFYRWSLPPAEEVEFNVSRDRGNLAHYNRYLRTNEHIIAFNPDHTWTATLLLIIMAHEMLHLYQEIAGLTTKTMHNRRFRKDGLAICRQMGWPLSEFMREC